MPSSSQGRAPAGRTHPRAWAGGRPGLRAPVPAAAAAALLRRGSASAAAAADRGGGVT